MKHNCLSNELCGYHVKEGQKGALDMVICMNSELICPWHSGAPLCRHELILLWQTSRHHRLLIYSFDSPGGACSSVRASGKDQMWGLKKKNRLLGAIDQSLQPAKNWNEMTPPTPSTLDVGPWPSPLARGVWNTDLFGWPSQQLSQAKGPFVKLGCQILKLTKKKPRNHFGRVGKNRKPNE